MSEVNARPAVISLTPEEQITGIDFSNTARTAHAAAEAAGKAERMFIEHLRKIHGAPADWVLIDWLVGFVPPPEGGHQHGHHHD